MSAQNDVRLLDAITIKHGPIDLLSRFFLAADQHVRDRGLRLSIRYDGEELAKLNRREVARGNWYPLLPAFNAELGELTPENSVWIAGTNAAGELVSAHTARLYRLHDSTLADQIERILFGDTKPSKPIIMNCPTASLVRGNVFFGGAAWIHPDYRRLGVATTAAKISRAYAAACWGVEWLTGFLQRPLYDKNMHHAYGFSEATLSIKVFDSPWGDTEIALMRQNVLELLAQLELFIAKASAPGEIRAA